MPPQLPVGGGVVPRAGQVPGDGLLQRGGAARGQARLVPRGRRLARRRRGRRLRRALGATRLAQLRVQTGVLFFKVPV